MAPLEHEGRVLDYSQLSRCIENQPWHGADKATSTESCLHHPLITWSGCWTLLHHMHVGCMAVCAVDLLVTSKHLEALGCVRVCIHAVSEHRHGKPDSGWKSSER